MNKIEMTKETLKMKEQGVSKADAKQNLFRMKGTRVSSITKVIKEVYGD